MSAMYQVVFTDGEDKGLREIPPPLCVKRLERGGWCLLPEGHPGGCIGIEYKPKEAEEKKQP